MSTFTVKEETLKEILSKLAPVVGDNSQNLNDNCVSIVVLDNNQIALSATNVNEYATIVADCVANDYDPNGRNEFSLVDFKRFKSIIDTVPGNDDVIITESGNGNINVDYGSRVGTKPIVVTAINTPFLQSPNTTYVDTVTVEMKILQESLKEATSIVQKDDVTVDACMHLQFDGYDIKMMAFDSKNGRVYRSMTKTGTGSNNNVGILLQCKKVAKAMKMFDNAVDVKINISNDFINITQKTASGSSDITEINYWIRRINVLFPSAFDQLFDVKSIQWATLNVDDVLNSLKRVIAIQDNDLTTEAVTLEIKGSEATFYKNSQYGDITDTIYSSTNVSDDFSDQFKADTLLEIINNFKKNNISTFTIGKPKKTKSSSTNNHYLLSQDEFNSPATFVLLGQGPTTTP